MWPLLKLDSTPRMRESQDTSSSPQGSAHSVATKLLCELKQAPLRAIQQLHQLTAGAEKEHRLEDALIFTNAGLKVAREESDGPAMILTLLTRGRLLFKMNRLEDAIPDLQDALLRSAAEPSISAPHRTHILYTASNLIAASLWKQGDRTTAAIALKETTRLARERFGAGSDEVMKALFDQAFLAIEMRKPESDILSMINACVQEPGSVQNRASHLLELGKSLYTNCLWDTASYTLLAANERSDNRAEKTEALLTLAHIASYTSDTENLHRFLDKAESFWMDVAPRPHLERHIAHLRALSALQEGQEETYRVQIFKAQQLGELEEPTIEDRIQIQFIRAQVLRRSGLYEEAHREIDKARHIVQRAIVSPLARCSILLQQAYCEQVEENYVESNALIEDALTITQKELDHNTLLQARGRSLMAHNFYSIFTYSGPSTPPNNTSLHEAKHNADTALQLLTEQNLDPHHRKILLRLLSNITSHLGLAVEQESYDRQLTMLESRFPNTSL
jgi:tetratricopeptide (TPR) repeat protein